jgi:hypothetical protein
MHSWFDLYRCDDDDDDNNNNNNKDTFDQKQWSLLYLISVQNSHCMSRR